MAPDQFWQEFLQTSGLPRETRYYECFHFELSELLANKLLALVLSGEKRATASSLFSFEAEGVRLPEVGDYSIITDWAGIPCCIIRTTAVTVLPFCEITYEICSREGEDETLESWQRGHKRFFTEEGAELGYEFSDDMPVLFEDFEVVYQK